MTRSDLNHFFVYCGLPVDLSESSLAELKKSLLLELKSGSGGVLNINGKEWTKNDILQFFDSPLHEGFDLNEFLEKYPWMQEIYTPEKVKYRESIRKIDFSTEEFAAFRKSESPALEERFERQLRARLSKQEDHHALALLLYRNVFSQEFCDFILRQVRQLLLYRCKEASAKMEKNTSRASRLDASDFLRYKQYFDLLEEVAADDNELLDATVEVYSESVNAMVLAQAYSIMKNLRRFKYGPAIEVYLDEVQGNIERLRAKESKSMERDNSFNYVYAIIVLIIIVARLVLFMRR